MAVTLTDPEIAILIAEPKPLPANFLTRSVPKPKRGHKESELAIDGSADSKFRLIFRMALFNQLDFSVILAVDIPGHSGSFRLRRYNGKSHEHTNRIEGDRIYGFHIHMATERYQAFGAAEDGYAELTDRYSDFQTALQCLVSDCSCVVASSSTLF
ncbi:MAG TPA: hypothetical protein VGI12_21810 [Vicinamibacterales bacterium]